MEDFKEVAVNPAGLADEDTPATGDDPVQTARTATQGRRGNPDQREPVDTKDGEEVAVVRVLEVILDTRESVEIPATTAHQDRMEYRDRVAGWERWVFAGL